MKYKYPRTYHLPRSEGRSRDDLALKGVSHFFGTKEYCKLPKLKLVPELYSGIFDEIKNDRRYE